MTDRVIAFDERAELLDGLAAADRELDWRPVVEQAFRRMESAIASYEDEVIVARGVSRGARLLGRVARAVVPWTNWPLEPPLRASYAPWPISYHAITVRCPDGQAAAEIHRRWFASEYEDTVVGTVRLGEADVVVIVEQNFAIVERELGLLNHVSAPAYQSALASYERLCDDAQRTRER
jgi:hypothetical protein